MLLHGMMLGKIKKQKLKKKGMNLLYKPFHKNSIPHLKRAY